MGKSFSGRSYGILSIKDIHSLDACFSVYPLKNFTTNFKNLKKKDGLMKKYGRVEGVSVSGRGQTAGTADGPLIES
jgi:hypothetical protein